MPVSIGVFGGNLSGLAKRDSRLGLAASQNSLPLSILALELANGGRFKTQNGEMTKWRNGEMKKWRNGEMVLKIRAKVIRY